MREAYQDAHCRLLTVPSLASPCSGKFDGALNGLAITPSTAYDGSMIKQALGYDGGFTAGMYLKYTFKNATVLDSKGGNGFIASTQMNIWSVSLFGLVFNNATCDYSQPNVTAVICPPSNCMLAACNARNIQDDGPFGDFCDGYNGVITTTSTAGAWPQSSAASAQVALSDKLLLLSSCSPHRHLHRALFVTFSTLHTPSAAPDCAHLFFHRAQAPTSEPPTSQPSGATLF